MRQHQAGAAVVDICPHLAVSEATFWVRKRKYANLGVSELRELRQLRNENTRLNRRVAGSTPDKQILSDVVEKYSKANKTARVRGLDARQISDQYAANRRVGPVFPGGLVSSQHG